MDVRKLSGKREAGSGKRGKRNGPGSGKREAGEAERTGKREAGSGGSGTDREARDNLLPEPHQTTTTPYHYLVRNIPLVPFHISDCALWRYPFRSTAFIGSVLITIAPSPSSP